MNMTVVITSPYSGAGSDRYEFFETFYLRSNFLELFHGITVKIVAGILSLFHYVGLFFDYSQHIAGCLVAILTLYKVQEGFLDQRSEIRHRKMYSMKDIQYPCREVLEFQQETLEYG
jgi:hypothetical protein